MSMARNIFMGLCALIAGGMVVTAVAKPDQGSKDGAKIGQAAPDFSLMDQNGKTVRLSDYKDKIVVLEWFNNECPFVKKFYREGHMNKFAQAASEKGVVWLAINSTHSSNKQSNKSISEEWNIDRPILDDSNGDAGHMYGAQRTPHMFVINKGTLAYMGAIDDKASPETSDIDGATNYVLKAIDELQAGQSVSTPETKPYGCGVKYGK